MQEVHHIAGEDCYLVKARVADTEALGDLLRERFGAISSVRTTRSTVVLHTLKETEQLPIPDDETAEDRREEGRRHDDTITKSRDPRLALRIGAAFLAVYIIWGSTYLAIKVAIQTMPPLLMAGARFLVAGGLVFGWLLLRGAARPKLVHWRSALILGGLLLFAGNGGVTWAEHHSLRAGGAHRRDGATLRRAARLAAARRRAPDGCGSLGW